MPHIHEKIDFTVETFIVHKNRVLLRMHDKYKIWLSVGGHIELDEDPIDAAVREVLEEVGLTIKLAGGETRHTYSDGAIGLLPPRFMNRNRMSDTHEHVTLVYFATCETDQVVAGGDDRSDEWRWFSKEDINSGTYELRENIKQYALEALDALGTG